MSVAALRLPEPPEEPVSVPNATPFILITENINDLLIEAKNWADGEPITTEAQSEAVSRLISDLNDQAAAAEAARVDEKEPLDKQIKEIQDRYNPFIADRKNKVPGKVWKAVDALKATLQPYLAKVEADLREAERLANEAAEAAAAVARKAIEDAAASDITATEAAEDLIHEAEVAQRVAKVATGAKATATGGSRAMSLRTVWKAEITDATAAVFHYWKNNPDAFTPLLEKLANDDKLAGKRNGIPGVHIYSEQVL